MIQLKPRKCNIGEVINEEFALKLILKFYAFDVQLNNSSFLPFSVMMIFFQLNFPAFILTL